MKHKIFWAVFSVFLISCKSSPHKAEKLQTDLAQAQAVSGSQALGLKNGEMVVMDKGQISEKLRDLQNSVYSLEDKVYGTRKLGTLGLYGELKACKRKLASRQFGGTGNMIWSEPLDRVTDKEEELKVGVDEKKELVGVSEEFLKDRLQRFQGYKAILQKRSDEFSEKIETCKAEVTTKEMDTNQPNKVMVTEVPKSSTDRTQINEFMCGYVRSGASLQSFMLNAFAKGWLALSDFKMDQNLISVSLKDAKGVSKDNALLFNGWKLSFDRSPVTVGELFNEGKDAQLTAWTYDKKAEVSKASKCLAANEGHWNQ